jgi:hypothetical protein
VSEANKTSNKMNTRQETVTAVDQFVGLTIHLSLSIKTDFSRIVDGCDTSNTVMIET